MDLSLYMTVAEAAAELKLSKSRIGQFIKDGKLLVRGELGQMRLLLKSEVRAFKPQVRGKAGRPHAAPAPSARKPRGKESRP